MSTTDADAGITTTSIALDDLTLEQLVQLQQGLGRQVDRLREQRAYLKAKIDERLARGERTSTDPIANPAPSGGEAQTITSEDVAVVDATAPGVVLEAAALKH